MSFLTFFSSSSSQHQTFAELNAFELHWEGMNSLKKNNESQTFVLH